LKQHEVRAVVAHHLVAPLAGAWIETISESHAADQPRSRPSRARGLKQMDATGNKTTRKSRPSRARGLKLLHPERQAIQVQSRPSRARGLKLVPTCRAPVRIATSRPSRARGLKPTRFQNQNKAGKSRPSRARGLKLDGAPQISELAGRAPRGRVD